MKRKEIERLLREESLSHTPDVSDRVKEAARQPQEGEIVLFPEGRTNKTGGRRAQQRERRNITRRVVASCMALVLCLAVVLPVAIYYVQSGRQQNVVDNGSNGSNGSDGSTVTAVSLSTTEVYALGAVTTVSLIDSAFSSSGASALSKITPLSSLAYDEAEEFHEYFKMLESFFGSDMVSTATETNTNEAYSDYGIKLTVSGSDLLGNAISYVMYYNETLVKEEIDKDEEEREYSISGVMVTEAGEYAIRGERTSETETEKGETETEEEIVIRAYPDLSDMSSYVQMKQEISVESDETEKEYVYAVYENGKKTEETSLQFEAETENGKQEIEYELEFLSGAGKGKYVLKKVTSGSASYMRVDYTIDGESGRYTITENADGTYTYTFSDGSVKIF